MLVLSELKRRTFSEEWHRGLFFDLDQEIRVGNPPFPLHIRGLLPEDPSLLFCSSNRYLGTCEARERLQRLLFLRADVSRCFVASGPDSFPCAICWLLTHEDNPLLEVYFKGNLPLLNPGEVLLEFVYVHPQYRGMKLMDWISKKLFSQAKLQGATRAIAYVRRGNRVSLAASDYIGWRPFLEKRVTWRFFRRHVTYNPVPGKDTVFETLLPAGEGKR